jgi:hypothetical protein
MPRLSPAEKLKRLEEKEAKLKAEMSRVKARASQEERKKDTRRKILLGSLVLGQKAKREAAWWADWLKYLDAFLEKDRDRELFGLPPRPRDGS